MPRRTVDDEHSLLLFSIMPAAMQRFRSLVETPDERQLDPNTLIQYGDSKVRRADMLRLVRFDCDTYENESNHYLTGDVINMMTNLISSVNRGREVYFLSTYTVPLAREILFGDRAKSTKERAEMFNALVSSLSIAGQGQATCLRDVAEAFAPCHTNGNYWRGFKINRIDAAVTTVDSLYSELLRDEPDDKYAEALMRLLESFDGRKWKYLGCDASLFDRKMAWTAAFSCF